MHRTSGELSGPREALCIQNGRESGQGFSAIFGYTIFAADRAVHQTGFFHCGNLGADHLLVEPGSLDDIFVSKRLISVRQGLKNLFLLRA